MTHLPDIWQCIQEHLPKGRWVSLADIYRMVEEVLPLDEEDYAPQAPGSCVPKWKRNVRNVLQYRKKTGEVQWDERGNYKL